MSDTRTVRGPLYIEKTPLTVTADVTPLVHANVAELLELLAGEFYDDFREVADQEPTGSHDGHAAERLGFEDLAARLTEYMATKVALTGKQAVHVAGQMHKLGLPLAETAARTEAVVRAREKAAARKADAA